MNVEVTIPDGHYCTDCPLFNDGAMAGFVPTCKYLNKTLGLRQQYIEIIQGDYASKDLECPNYQE